jgi:sugar O-acyltransferase (sialic acid O-acetyltransferase NeuD family)
MTRWATVATASTRVVVWGAADQFRVDYPILKSLGIHVEALVDDTPDLASPVKGIPIYRGEEGLERFLGGSISKGLGFVIAIGNPYGNVRMRLHHLLTGRGLAPVSFADPSALICASARYGDGLQVMPAAIVHNEARIGRQCILNTRALVEHDCVLGDGVELAPGAVLCGRVHLGDNVWIGANATVRPRVTIGENTIIGAGAVVVSDIPAGVVAVGVPARVVRENKVSR